MSPGERGAICEYVAQHGIPATVDALEAESAKLPDSSYTVADRVAAGNKLAQECGD